MGSRSTPTDFSVRTLFDDQRCVVEMSGALDLASRGALVEACTAIDLRDVVVDLSGLEFMDCAGFGALEESTTILEQRGGSLGLRNPVGEPRRLLAMIEALELDRCEPAGWDTFPGARAVPSPG